MKKILWKISKILPDKLVINLLYRDVYGCYPDLKNPRTFDEKIQWYKLYYRNPLMTALADKYAVRKYVEEKGLAAILNELYGVYDNADEIDLSGLPDRFIIKATHGWNMNFTCKDKKSLHWSECCRTMNGWLKTNHYASAREWSYKNIKPRLICEKYLENEAFHELIDYKFYCYNSKPEVLFVCTGRFSPGGVKYNAYDMNWNRIYAYKGKPCSDLVIEKPKTFEFMVSVAEKLCEGFPFVRIDLYSLEDRVIFGEATFYPDAGFVPFTPEHYNFVFGDYFILPEKL